jgi:uncharacterized protein with HEPN domain
MSDPELVCSILNNMLTAIERIERRFKDIAEPDDFVTSDSGLDRLDGITMMLIAIGEQLKQLDRVLDFELDERYPDVDWKGVKGIRDFLSHHYFTVDAEIIFDICQNKLVGLKLAVLDMHLKG